MTAVIQSDVSDAKWCQWCKMMSVTQNDIMDAKWRQWREMMSVWYKMTQIHVSDAKWP